jgi:hypothetical protein
MTISRVLAWLRLAALSLYAMDPLAIALAEAVDYDRDVKPILRRPAVIVLP